MRGGIRQGAGRKPSESTVRVSVPVGILDGVNKLIAAYKSGTLNDCQIIEDEYLNDCQEFKQTDTLLESHEIKKDDCLINNQGIKDAVKGLQGLNSRTTKVLRKKFGSLFKAAELGVRAKPDGGIQVPHELCYLMD